MSFSTHVRKRLTDAEAASIISRLKFSVSSERAQSTKSDNSTSDHITCVSSDDTTNSDSSDEESTGSDDDVVIYDEKEYSYRYRKSFGHGRRL